MPHPDGVAAGKTVGAEAFRAALDEYYRLRGWDAEGVPTAARWPAVAGRPALSRRAAGAGAAAHEPEGAMSSADE